MISPVPDAPSVNGQRPYAADAGLDPSITPNEKAVLLALDAHEGMACYHALHLATGLRGSSLQRAIRGLEARGLARRERLDSTTWAVVVGCPGAEEEDDSPEDTPRPVATDQSRICLKEGENPLPSEDTPRSNDPPLVRELVEAGVWRREAVRLAREHDEAMVRFWIEQALLWGPDIKNRGGWIKCALDEGYRLPAPDPRTDPAEMRERLSQAVWAAMAPEDKARTLHEAKAENSEWCRKAREIAGWCPSFRDGMNATIGQEYIWRHLLVTSAPGHDRFVTPIANNPRCLMETLDS